MDSKPLLSLAFHVRRLYVFRKERHVRWAAAIMHVQAPDIVTELIQNNPTAQLAILHICKREMLRPLRDQILRLSGYHVDSTCSIAEGLKFFSARDYALVLIDVEGEQGVVEAEKLCTEVKTTKPGQVVAFVCNWRVAILTDCPNEIVRTEFDPAAFVAGVEDIVRKH
jgi:hypothetical protein